MKEYVKIVYKSICLRWLRAISITTTKIPKRYIRYIHLIIAICKSKKAITNKTIIFPTVKISGVNHHPAHITQNRETINPLLSKFPLF